MESFDFGTFELSERELSLAGLEVASEQINARRLSAKLVQEVVEAWPAGTPLDNAANHERLPELYRALSTVLEDPDYVRLSLYLPFEILEPPAISSLSADYYRFRESYLHSWRTCLYMSDVEANFINGDVLEFNLREQDPPRVIKALQIAPKLIDIGLISMEELKDTIISMDHLKYYDASSVVDTIKNPNSPSSNTLVGSIGGRNTEMAASEHLECNEVTSPARARWLVAESRELEISRLADSIANSILQNPNSIQALKDLASLVDAGIHCQGLDKEAVIESIPRALMAIPGEDLDEEVCLNGILILLSSLLNQANFRTRAVRSLLKMNYLGLASKELLMGIGVNVPNLTGEYIENFKLMEDEALLIEGLISAIEEDEYLSRRIMPTFIVLGSRIKGYGDGESDIDISVFIKPGTPHSEKNVIRSRLKTTFANCGIQDQPIEVWLDISGQYLRVHDFEDYDYHIAYSHWSHLFFNGVWVGDSETTEPFATKIIAPYLRESDELKRSMYIERLEQDSLQYRLLHKGYYRLRPRAIDPMMDSHDDSAFWDPGFRRLATILFMKRVFIPKV